MTFLSYVSIGFWDLGFNYPLCTHVQVLHKTKPIFQHNTFLWVMKVGVGFGNPNNFKHGVNLGLMQVLHSWMGLTPNGSRSKIGQFSYAFVCGYYIIRSHFKNIILTSKGRS